MNDAFDDDLRTGVQVLMNDAPSPPEWERVRGAQARLRRRHNLRWGALGVLAVLLGVVLIGRQANVDDTTVVAGPPDDASQQGCGPYSVAVHTLFDSAIGGRNPGPSTVTAEQVAFLAKSGDVPDRVARELGGHPADLAERMVAKANSNLGTVEITARANTPGEARKLADSFAEGVLASVSDIHQRETDRARSVLQARIEQLEVVTGDPRMTDLQTQLLELDQRALAGPTIYSMGSSEAFQVSKSQLDELFSPEADWRDSEDC